MEITEALTVLGLDGASTFEDMRSAYRELLLKHHPDVDPRPEAAETTAAVVEAFRFLRAETQDGTVALPQPELPVPGSDAAPVLLIARPGDVFARLLAATEEVAEISGVDRHSGFLQAVVTEPGYGPSQLTAELDTSQGDSRILFTLESLSEQPGPPIADIVGRISPYL